MSDENNAVPATPEGYAPRVHGFEGAKVDTSHPGYRSAAQAAHEAGLTQAQFSKLLAHEARRVQTAQAQQKPAAPAPAPAAQERKTIPGYKNMTMAQKLAAGGHTKI